MKMKQVCSEKYDADILSKSGNDENIENRRKLEIKQYQIL